MKKVINYKSIIFKISLLILMFIFFSVIFILINYRQLNKHEIDRILNKNKNNILKTYSIIDEDLHGIVKIINNFDDEYWIKNINNTKELQNQLQFLKNTNSYIHNIGIISNDNKLVTPSNCYNTDQFLKEYCIQSESYIKDHQQQLRVIPKQTYKVNGRYGKRKYELIFIFSQFHKDYSDMIILNEAVLQNRLYNLVNEQNISIILDKDNKLISSNIDIDNIDINIIDLNNKLTVSYFTKKNYIILNNQKYIYVQQNSKNLSFKYITLVPLNSIYDKANFMGSNFRNIIIFILVISVLLILILSKEIYVPLVKINKSLSHISLQKKNYYNEFEIICDKLKKINQEQLRVKDELRRKGDIEKQIYLYRLLNDFNDKDLIDKVKNKLEYNKYIVIIVIMETNDLILKQKKLELLQNNLKSNFIYQKIFTLSKEVYYVINVKDKDYQSILNNIIDQIKENVKLYIGISNIYNDISKIKQCCKESYYAILYRSIDYKKSLYYYCNVSISYDSSIKIPFDKEKEFISNIYKGNKKNVSDFFDFITKENEQLNFKQLKDLYLYLEKLAVIVMKNKLITYQDIFDKVEEFDIDQIKESYDDQFIKQCIKSFYLKIAAYCKDQKNDIQTYMINYVNENYKTLYLEQLADVIGMSPSYTSIYFKKVMGTNFSTYIQYLKVDEAKKLLAKNDKNIKEIANELGFNESNTFIRLFKKFEGITPGEYRKRFLQKQLKNKFNAI